MTDAQSAEIVKNGGFGARVRRRRECSGGLREHALSENFEIWSLVNAIACVLRAIFIGKREKISKMYSNNCTAYLNEQSSDTSK